MLVRYAANFLTNLDAIEAFWDRSAFPAGFDRLMDELTCKVVPNLERHPKFGRDFLARSVVTADVQGKIEHICRIYATGSSLPQLREYVMTDYLLLYVLGTDAIDLLAVKHHKQLSFDIHI